MDKADMKLIGDVVTAQQACVTYRLLMTPPMVTSNVVNSITNMHRTKHGANLL